MPLNAFFSAHTATTEAYRAHITKVCKVIFYKAGEMVKFPGVSKKAAYFVAKGLLITYTVDQQRRQRIIDFTWEKQTCASTAATYFVSTNDDYIQCVEDSIIIQFSIANIIYIISHFREGRIFYKKSLKQILRRSLTHLILMQIDDKVHRLLKFEEVFKELLPRLSIELRANYLSIHRSTLHKAQRFILKKKP